MAESILSPDEKVAMLHKYVAEGAHDTQMIARLIRDVIEGDLWREFRSKATGVTRKFISFREFVESKVGGLGTSKNALVAWVREADQSAADLVEKAWREEIPAAGKQGRPGKDSDTAITGSTETADGITARAKRDDPELAERIINGEITPNAAALQKGWRKPRVVLSNPASVAASIRKHWDADLIEQLKEEL